MAEDLYQTLNKGLYKIIPAKSSGFYEIAPESIGDGPVLGVFEQNIGNYSNGKKDFDNTDAGYILGVDKGIAKFYIGDSTNYLNWDGTTLTIAGALSASSGTIGGFDIGADYIRDVANSMGLASTVTGGDDVRFWAGDTFANRTTAPFRVTEAGAVTATNITITGGSVATGTLSGLVGLSNVNVAAQGWTQTSVFSITDADTVAWGAGVFTTASGTTYSISAGNTGNMAAKTYIYLDIAVSTTVYQTTTTPATALGSGKVLVAVAQNGTVEPTFAVLQGQGAQNIDAASIVASSITANEIAAGAVTAGKISVSQLSAIAADLGSITAGSITINGGVASISSSGDAVFKSIQVGGSSKQYTIGDTGILNYGDGSDGAVTFANQGTAPAGTTKTDNTNGATIFRLDRDVYYTTATIDSTVTVLPNGYRIFCSTSVTINGTVRGSGNAGAVGTAAISADNTPKAGGAGGAALADGYLKGSLAGPDGATGPAGGGGGGNNGANGTNGTNTSNSIGSNGVAGGTGGTNGGTFVAGNGGSGGTVTASNVRLIANWHLATLLDISSSGSTVKFDNSASSGSGGSGSTHASNTAGAGGGGAGSGGRIIAIYAKTITVGAAGVITVAGGAGGAGGAAASNAGAGGGGAGGNGGQVILVYNAYTNSGSVTAAGGAVGAAGSGGTGAASAGTVGTDGTIRTFQLSL